MLEFRNIVKKFKETLVINDISFSVKKGELVVLIGESGCGKTTTLKMINRLIDPTSGTILINGEDIAKKDVISLRRNMGYVIQQTGLFPHMSVKENIEIIPKVSKINAKKIKDKTLELMEMIGMDPDEFLERYPIELSGGQQQRIGVARAFAMDPEIILMDEPFSALDPITRASLQEELINIQTHMKKTIIFVTHDMSEAIKIADRICIMNNGKILQYDTPENIMKNPINDFVSRFVGKNRIWSSPELIKVKDIMIENPVTIPPKASLFQCMEKMREHKIDSLMVVELHTNKLLGIIKAKHIQPYKNRDIEVEKIMKKDFSHALPEESIVEVLKLINKTQESTLPIINEKRCLVGLITKSSLVTTLSQPFVEQKEVI